MVHLEDIQADIDVDLIDEAVAQVVPPDNSMASQIDNLAVRQEDQQMI